MFKFMPIKCKKLFFFKVITVFSIIFVTYILKKSTKINAKQAINLIQSIEIYSNDPEQFSVALDGKIYPQYVPLYYNKNINFKLLNASNKRKRILLWNRYWSTSDYFFGLGNRTPFINNNCPVVNCEITDNKQLYSQSDFVVFHMMERMDPPPKHRIENQYWVFYENESPMDAIDFSEYNDMFNVSSTYRSDSMATSIYYAESSFYWQLNKNFNENQNFLSGKDRFAATVISSCHDKNNRFGYIPELQKYISVEVFGKCGRTCPFVECHQYIANKFKFFIAFENAFCKDYITEKFFNMLKHNIIPVVLGGGTYDRFVPKSGYINALDYGTVENLAKHLIYLSNNAIAYNSYFKWKKYVIFDSLNPFYGHLCEWCILLNLKEQNKLNEDSNIKVMNKFWNRAVDCRWPDKSNSSVFRYLDMKYADKQRDKSNQILIS